MRASVVDNLAKCLTFKTNACLERIIASFNFPAMHLVCHQKAMTIVGITKFFWKSMLSGGSMLVVPVRT